MEGNLIMMQLQRAPMAQEMSNLTHVAERLVNESPFGRPLRTLRAINELGKPRVRLQLPVDVYTTAKELIVVAAVPGLGPDDLAITWDARHVILRGTLPDALPADDATTPAGVTREMATGPFERTVPLLVDVAPERAVATVDQGLLTLRLPRTDAASGRHIAVRNA